MKAMVDEARKAVALSYLRAVDSGGITESGGSIIDLFADDAIVHFPKWGTARGKAEIGRMLMDVTALLQSVNHHLDAVSWVFSGGDVVVCEGTSHGIHRDGAWQADSPAWGAGHWCDVFEIRDGLIHRCFVYLDPDYAGRDTERYPWIQR
ncbi:MULTISPECIES: nuclear transport factor 2 family protein [unclassified Burkholderia]|uniref:nuclear transport factor 2 family protein n=1 Tax=unclassified Burkholderia TaxID=2613784 RepID=UPI0021AB275C|nr:MULTISPECIES: nuclear transport factor 2 family protein [unclassified Burkholderia]